MDIFSLVVIVFAFAAAAVVWMQLQGKKPEPAELIPVSSPGRRHKKKKPEEKKQENFKWDAPDKTTKTRETDKDFNPVKAGKKLVQEAKESKETDKKQELSDRQKNKLQSQGFVTHEKPKFKRTGSASDVEDDEDGEGEYAGMSAATAERLKLLEKIASGKRVGPDDGFAGKKDDKKKSGSIGEERRVDHKIVAERLAKEKEERKAAEDAKTKIGGGRIAFQGAGVKSGGNNCWARPSGAASPSAAEDTEEAPAADGDGDE